MPLLMSDIVAMRMRPRKWLSSTEGWTGGAPEPRVPHSAKFTGRLPGCDIDGDEHAGGTSSSGRARAGARGLCGRIQAPSHRRRPRSRRRPRLRSFGDLPGDGPPATPRADPKPSTDRDRGWPERRPIDGPGRTLAGPDPVHLPGQRGRRDRRGRPGRDRLHPWLRQLEGTTTSSFAPSSRTAQRSRHVAGRRSPGRRVLHRCRSSGQTAGSTSRCTRHQSRRDRAGTTQSPRRSRQSTRTAPCATAGPSCDQRRCTTTA